MRTKISLGLAAVVIALTTSALTAAPGYADTGNADIQTGGWVLQGAGTLSPGLTTTPTSQTFSFSGSGAWIVGLQTSLSGVYQCNIAGASFAPETVLNGEGSINGSCSGPTTVAISGQYTRDAGYALWVLTGTVSGSINTNFTGTCTTVPTSVPTVTSYRIVCAFVFFE